MLQFRRRWAGLVFCIAATIQTSLVRADLFEVAGKQYTVTADHILKKEPPASLQSLLNVRLWSDTLDDTQKRLGASTQLPRAEHQAKRVCYRSDNNQDGVLVIFYADAPGSWRRITGFRLSAEPASGVDSKLCRPVKELVKSVSLGGVNIGALKQVLATTLGPPAAELPSSELRVYEYKERLAGPELSRLGASFPELKRHPYLLVTMLVHSEYRDGQLAALEVHVVKELPGK